MYLVDTAMSADEDKNIFVSDQEILSLISAWRSQVGRDPTDDELARIINNLIDEEILYREALLLGLDQEDTIIKRRLAQKISFLKEESIPEIPTTEELNEYYKNNKSQTYLRCYKRRRNLEQQTPKWSDYNKILKIYKKAEQLREQGKKVNVDHIIPLKNKFVCGLNVPENLKIIEDKLNFRKSNKFIPFLNYKIYGTKRYYEMLQSVNYSLKIKSF